MTTIQDIKKEKASLIKKAKTYWIWENFWQKEYRKLQDNYTLYSNEEIDEALFQFQIFISEYS